MLENYDHSAWSLGDRALITVDASREVKSGTYLYELSPRSRTRQGDPRWSAIRLPDEAPTPHGRRVWIEDHRTTHAMSDSAVRRCAAHIEKVLPNCPCCAEFLL